MADCDKQCLRMLKLLANIFINVRYRFKPLRSSRQYWIERYSHGGNSGFGSLYKFAEFKANVLNKFVNEHAVATVIEYGCGDGNQLSLAHYPRYTGFDISPLAISLCRNNFKNDKSKTFKLMHEYWGETAQLALSLDVVYHLIEDDVFHDYMKRLFDSSEKYVIIYSTNIDKQQVFQAKHVRHRRFTDWINENRPQWSLQQRIPGVYSGKVSNDFFIFMSDT
jgi:SAM-dependent methyltransferase